MSEQTMKIRTGKQLMAMGVSADEAKKLIEKHWENVSYLKKAREKALYMIA